MKIEDVKIGMKVAAPLKKWYVSGEGLENSNEWAHGGG